MVATLHARHRIELRREARCTAGQLWRHSYLRSGVTDFHGLRAQRLQQRDANLLLRVRRQRGPALPPLHTQLQPSCCEAVLDQHARQLPRAQRVSLQPRVEPATYRSVPDRSLGSTSRGGCRAVVQALSHRGGVRLCDTCRSHNCRLAVRVTRNLLVGDGAAATRAGRRKRRAG
jgi:hypothetical protein